MHSKLILLVFTVIQLQNVTLQPAPRIKIEQGTLEGTYLTSTNGRKFMAFQGIPYASPPVNKMRFKVLVNMYIKNFLNFGTKIT